MNNLNMQMISQKRTFKSDKGIIDSVPPIGHWGRLHLDYIKDNQINFFNKLSESNTLWNYLDNVDKHAQRKFEEMINMLSKKLDIEFQLKNELAFLVEEIVLEEIIYHVI